MKMPTQAQIDAGGLIAAELMDALIENTLGGLGGNQGNTLAESNNADLIQLHLDHKIDSVTAIWIAMERAIEHGTT